MTKTIVRGVLLIVLLCACILFQAHVSCAQESARQLQKLSDHVYAYVNVQNPSPSANSFGANCGFVVGRDAVLVVDTLVSAKEGLRLLADIRKITDKPIRYVVNTHFHLDHAFGNCVFTKEGATVIAHESSRVTAPRAEYALTHYTKYGLSQEDMTGTALCPPTVTFSTTMRVDLGDVMVDLAYWGPSHTDGSITVSVEQDKVIFLGDILFTRFFPYLGEGNIPSWVKVLDDVAHTKAKIIVPGHGPLSTISDIRDMQTYLKIFAFQARLLCMGKRQEDAPELAKKIMKLLPDQGRTELPMLVESSLRDKYLPIAYSSQRSEK